MAFLKYLKGSTRTLLYNFVKDLIHCQSFVATPCNVLRVYEAYGFWYFLEIKVKRLVWLILNLYIILLYTHLYHFYIVRVK